MLCPNCGAEIEEGRPDCPKCFNPVSKPGLLRRLWNSFLAPAPLRGLTGTTGTVIKTSARKHFVIIDQMTGERRKFDSLEQLPPDLRAKLEEAMAKGKVVSKATTFTFRGIDGQGHSYHSIEEMPPETRAVFEKFVLPEIQAEMGENTAGKLPLDPPARPEDKPQEP